jgi:EAL domain-containing protein (putative c-di-GMP-specific phosphodiesterase class I)
LVVLESLIHLGRELGMQVVAQGIETQQQLDGLRSLGCEMGQGELLQRAIEPAQAIQLAPLSSLVSVADANVP